MFWIAFSAGNPIGRIVGPEAMKFGGWQRLNAEYAKQFGIETPNWPPQEREDKLIMKEATKRSIFRWIHIIFGIPILGYIYESVRTTPKLRLRYSVCLSSCIAPFGTVDVERPCRSTTYFEESQQNYWHENGTRIGGIKIQ